jgi:hypothetical protein
MNVQQTTEIRELTAAELDAVSGGVTAYDVTFMGFVGGMTLFAWSAVTTVITAIWDAIFD